MNFRYAHPPALHLPRYRTLVLCRRWPRGRAGSTPDREWPGPAPPVAALGQWAGNALLTTPAIRAWTTCVEYDQPSTVFGKFGDPSITEVATMFDQELEQLVAAAIR